MEPDQDDSSSYVNSWLAKTDWSDPTGLHNQHDQDSTPPLSSTSTPPPSPSPFVPHGRAEIAKRKRRMNSDVASDASGGTSRTRSTTTSFPKRPILHPTPPSSRQRSTSPTRKVLSQLKLATPSLRVCQPDVRLEQSPAVRQLRSMLINKLSAEVIPYSLQVIVFPLDQIYC